MQIDKKKPTNVKKRQSKLHYLIFMQLSLQKIQENQLRGYITLEQCPIINKLIKITVAYIKSVHLENNLKIHFTTVSEI